MTMRQVFQGDLAHHIQGYEDAPDKILHDEDYRLAARTLFINNMSATNTAALISAYMQALDEKITALEVHEVVYAEEARGLYRQYEALINSRLQKHQASKVPDIQLIESLRVTNDYLSTTPHDNAHPWAVRAHHQAFTQNMRAMKVAGVTAAAGAAGMLLAIAISIAAGIYIGLSTFGIIGAAALTTTSLLTFGGMAVGEAGVVAWAAYKTVGLFNNANKSLGVARKMNALTDVVERERQRI